MINKLIIRKSLYESCFTDLCQLYIIIMFILYMEILDSFIIM